MTTLTTARPALSPAARPANSIFGALGQMVALRRQRRALAKLDAVQLCDIGVGRAQAQAEAMRPVWDVPTNWLR